MKQCVKCKMWAGPRTFNCANCNTPFPKAGKAKSTRLCLGCNKSMHYKALKCPRCNTVARESAKEVKEKKAAAAKALLEKAAAFFSLTSFALSLATVLHLGHFKAL